MPERPPLVSTYSRPVRARLVVRLDNGEEWDATADDVAQFGLLSPTEVNTRIIAWLQEHLGTRTLTETNLNPLRYLYECAMNYSYMPDADTAAELRAVIALGIPWENDDEDPQTP